MTIVAVRTQRGTTLIGEYGELRGHLIALRNEGRLTPDGLIAHGPTADGRHFARVRLVEVAPRRRVRRGVIVAGVTAAAVALGVAGWLAVLAVAWLVAHIWQIAAVLLIVGLAYVGLSRVGVCPGLHCPGCRHR